MKTHRPLLEALRESLKMTFNQNQPADKVLEKLFKKSRQFGSRDRRWLAETFYSIVRWWRPFIEHVQGSWSDERHDFTDEQVRAVIELALENKDPSRLGRPEVRASLNSIPDWLDEVGAQELGSSWDLILKSLNEPAQVYLRVNTLKSNLQELKARLADEGIESDLVDGVPTALVLKERKNVFQTKAFLSGLFEVQDAGSQLLAPFLDPESKMRVIDACAGAGGKSLHIAALMKNSGRILALDIHEWKLKELRTRASRNGVDTIETKLADPKIIKRNEGIADRVLLDVPCSGLGVIKRHPGTKWYLKKEELHQLQSIQKQILDDYSMMTKPGGKLVYATCSILPSENEGQVQDFLDKHLDFALEDEIRLSPFETGFDGFYGARLIRKGKISN